MNKRYLSILGIYQSPQCIQGQPLARALRRTWTGRPTWVPIDVTCCVFGCLPRNLWHGDVDASMRLCVYGSMGLWVYGNTEFAQLLRASALAGLSMSDR